MYTIRKEFHFSAGHRLHGLPDDHPCTKVHGHNYIITVELKDKFLNDVGFVKDYRELNTIKNFIDEVLDHQYLNDILPFNPSAENIARYIYETFIETTPQMTAVEVSETPKTSARYEP